MYRSISWGIESDNAGMVQLDINRGVLTDGKTQFAVSLVTHGSGQNVYFNATAKQLRQLATTFEAMAGGEE
jgi:hypothetical protein